MSEKPIVKVEKLRDGEPQFIGQFLTAFNDIGFIDDFRKARAIFIKPNLTYPIYRKGITTRVEFVSALVAALRSINDTTRIYIGEGEGSYQSFSMTEAMKTMGYKDIERRYKNVVVLNLSEMPSKSHTFETLRGPYTLEVPSLFFDEIDFSISCPLPKVHCYTKLTLSLKNLWGCLPDAMRLKHHYMFAHLISGIAEALKFKYAFLDGRYGLDKYGPMAGGNGVVVDLDWFVASNSLGAFDMVLSEMMGWDWKAIGHLKIAAKTGFCPQLRDISVIGDIMAFRRKFVLQRIPWNYPALIAFHSKFLTDFFYLSRYSKLMHDIMYKFRKKTIED